MHGDDTSPWKINRNCGGACRVEPVLMHINVIVDIVTELAGRGDYEISIQWESILNRSESPVYISCRFLLI